MARFFSYYCAVTTKLVPNLVREGQVSDHQWLTPVYRWRYYLHILQSNISTYKRV